MTGWEISKQTLKEVSSALGLMTAAMPAAMLKDVALQLERRRELGWECDFEAEHIPDRVDPSRSLPGVRSVVVAALPYRTVAWKEMRRPEGLRGALSKYAWGEDYHLVLRGRLEQLARALERAASRPVSWRVAVDTGPLVERAFAQASGLGWIGKNACLFVEPYGSWVFLGILLTDLVVEPGSAEGGSRRSGHSPTEEIPFARCGSCDKCMKACPTDAIVGPGMIDATRCLSYVTQMKGIIPKPLRRKMGTRIWGCDICQAVCPINRFSRIGEEPAFLPREDLAFPDLIELLAMGQRAFRRQFGRSAAAWRGVHVLRRNAAIALGNLKDPGAVPYLTPMLDDPRPEIRASAAWALGEIGGEAAREAVAAAARRESDSRVREEMEWALTADSVPAKPL